MYCPNCGKEIIKESKFCKFCGYDLSTPKSPVEDTTPVPQEIKPEANKEEKTFDETSKAEKPSKGTNKFLSYAVAIGVFVIAISVGRYLGGNQPAIFLQLFVAYALFWLGEKVVKSKLHAEQGRNSSRGRTVIILSVLGLVGLLSPIVGFLFALPAFLISKDSLTSDYGNRAKLMFLSGGVMVLCILNAAYGAYINSNYNFAVENNFVNACTKNGGQQSVCECAYNAIQSKYTFEEFKKIDQNATATGTLTPEIQQIFTDCATSTQ